VARRVARPWARERNPARRAAKQRDFASQNRYPVNCPTSAPSFPSASILGERPRGKMFSFHSPQHSSREQEPDARPVDNIQALRAALALARPAARSARASRNLRTALLFVVRGPRGKKWRGDESKAQHALPDDGKIPSCRSSAASPFVDCRFPSAVGPNTERSRAVCSTSCRPIRTKAQLMQLLSLAVLYG
jgi:hypothetical protein